MNALLTGIYTLTSTHCGTGQATGAIDLPIAREATTGLPILPATSLKGVLRDAFGPRGGGPLSPEIITRLFGPEIKKDTESSNRGARPEGEADRSSRALIAGELIVGEGHLLCYPLPSLNRPYLYATCPLILERLFRAMRAHGLGGLLPEALERDLGSLNGGRVRVAEAELARADALVIEDLVYAKEKVEFSKALADLGERLGLLLPPEERATAARLTTGLVQLSDQEMLALIRRVVPVAARVQLTSGKTTDRYEGESGNLWYEESLPSDCLFWSIMDTRSKHSRTDSDVERLWTAMRSGRHLQIGGNETVGQGQCTWTGWRD